MKKICRSKNRFISRVETLDTRQSLKSSLDEARIVQMSQANTEIIFFSCNVIHRKLLLLA